MSFFDKLSGRLTAPKLTRGRIMLALLIALAADALQIAPPLAIPPAPEIIDVIAMGLTIWMLGFHVLLLPTFVIEFIPIAGMLPTWTACVGAVIALRKRAEGKEVQPPGNLESISAPPTPPPQLPPVSNTPPVTPSKIDSPPNSISNPS